MELAATVATGKVRFTSRPSVEVGSFGAAVESRTERHNLPDRIEPGVTYRDARIRVEVEMRLEEEAAD